MSRLKFIVATVMVIMALARFGAAQGGGSSATGIVRDDKSVGSIRGGVLLPNGAPLNEAVKIKLRTPRGTEVTIFTDYQGQFEFKDIPTGNYELDAEASQDRFQIATQSVQVMKDLTIVITFTLKEKPSKDATAPGARKVVSVGELDPKVPKEARREFERASKAAMEHKPEEAITHLRRAVELYPDFMAAHNDLGAQLLEVGRLDEASAELRIAARLDPKAFNPRLNLGIILFKQRQYAEASQLFEQAVSLDPQSSASHFYMGMAQLMLKHPERAEKELLQAHDSGGVEYALALFHLGQLYLSQGRRDLALQCFESYLREAPDAPNAEQVKKLIATLR